MPPNANCQNLFRMFILRNNLVKRPNCLQIGCLGMSPMSFKLSRRRFAWHCFRKYFGQEPTKRHIYIYIRERKMMENSDDSLGGANTK